MAEELEAEYKRKMLEMHRDGYHTALDDVRPLDTAEFSTAFLSLKGKFQNCPKRMEPLCAESDRELTEMLKKCKTVNQDIRETCLKELKSDGFYQFQRCSSFQTRVARVNMHESLERLMRRQKRLEENVGI